MQRTRHHRSLRAVVVAAAALAGLAVLPVASLAAEVPRALRAWLHATDQSPTADQIRRASAHAQQELRAVARDPKEHRYARHRAVALLSRLADPAAEAALLELRSEPDAALRATVAVALAAGPGARRPAQVIRGLEAWYPSQPADVRAAVARGLAMIPDLAAARAAAVRLRKAEKDKALRQQLDRVIRAGSRGGRSEAQREGKAGRAVPKAR
ncbi:MAG: hypothetical protein H6747_02560 [Deltaproteobacteria bacterium]|nr:hypothetical protein [Deltaproteobacteria bacterium]